MKIIFEQQKEEEEDWRTLLDIPQEQLNELIRRGIFKRRRNNTFTCQFVGEIFTPSQRIISMPKVYAGTAPKSQDYSLTQKILKYYFQLKKQQSVSEENLTDVNFYKDDLSYEAATFLSLKRYLTTFGVYCTKEVKYRNGYSGKVDWKKTIKKKQPVIAHPSVIYPFVFNKHTQQVLNDISVIFMSIYKHLEEKYSKRPMDTYQNIHTVSLEFIKQNLTRNLSLLEMELAKTFNSEDVFILQVIKAYLSNSSFISKNSLYRIYGTTSFHVIWEEMCSQVFQNQYDEFKETLSQPVWSIQEGEETRDVPSNGDLKPDILLQRTAADYILDAKYYFPIPKNQCGVGDISKQYIYERIFPRQSGKQIYNVFLFPSLDSDILTKRGKITIPKSSLGSIFVVEVNYKKIATHFISSSQNDDYISALQNLNLI